MHHRLIDGESELPLSRSGRAYRAGKIISTAAVGLSLDGVISWTGCNYRGKSTPAEDGLRANRVPVGVGGRQVEIVKITQCGCYRGFDGGADSHGCECGHQTLGILFHKNLLCLRFAVRVGVITFS